MGRLKALTIILMLGAGGGATEGASRDDASDPSSRPPLPKPAAEYLKAAAYLQNSGRGELAGKYLQVAQEHRGELSPAEQTVLDEYLRKTSMAAPAAAPAAPAPAGRDWANSPGPIPAPPASRSPAAPAASDGSKVMTLEGRTGSIDPKQQARWALANAMDLARQNKFDEADRKVAEARQLNAKWTLFEDSPDKVAKFVDKARSRAGSVANAAAPVGGRDRKAAAAKLKQARDLMKDGQYDQAEAVAREVDSWNLTFALWEDKPSSVASAASALRRRDSIRKTGPLNRPSSDAYDALVAEARQMLAAGRLPEAETKAVQAQRLGVVPPVTSDRAESVLQAIELVKNQVPQQAPVGLAGAAAIPVAMAQPAPHAVPAADPAIRVTGVQEPAPLDTPLLPEAEPVAPLGMPPLDMPPVGLRPELEAPSQGQHLLNQARAFHEAGNFAAAREMANRVRNGGYGLEASADELASEINLKQQGAALALYEEALASVRDGHTEHARVLLNEVAHSESLDASLQQRVEDLLLKLGNGQAPQGAIDARADEDAVAAQRLNAEVAVKVGEARRLMEVDPDKGIATLQEALVAVKAADVPEAARRNMARRIEIALELAKKDKVSFDFKMQEKKFRDDVELKKLRILEADKAKVARVRDFMEKAQAAYAESKYDEAESYALRAQEVDPMDVAATAMAWKSRAQRGYQRDKEIRRDTERGVVTAFTEVSAAGVIDPEVATRDIAFPRSFAELTARRNRLNERTEIKSDPDRLMVSRKLEERLTFDMDKQPLVEVVHFLQNATGLNVVLDPKALMETGLTETQPISLRANTKINNALRLMLNPIGLTYDIQGDVLVITSPQNNAKVVQHAYPVGDLILAANQRKKMGNAQNPMGALGAMSGAVPDPSGADTKVDEVDTTTLDFTPLMQVITTTIAPGTWTVHDGKGGTLSLGNPSAGGAFGMGAGFGGGGALGEAQNMPPGSIIPYFLNISLIIRHTPEVHEDIVELLRQLRKLQDLQVSVEVRFITVNDNFFERIGVDFDFAIQSNINPKKNAFIQQNPAATPIAPGADAQPVAPFLVNPNFSRYVQGDRLPLTIGTNGPGDTGIPRISQNLNMPFLQDSYSSTNPFNAISGAGGSFGIAFLSDLEVYLFLQAAQGDTRSNIVQAPKVTTFNGASATVFNANIINYVQSLIPVVNFGAVAFQPQPAQIPDGVILTTVPVVSADRRYVRLTLAPFFQAIDGFDTFPVPAAVGGGGIGGGSASITGQISLPRTNTTSVDTTVTVPDGGTVLLGGVKRLREERTEFGVPILSKTPLINRLFKNVGIGRTTDSLMIMVTPRIIILEEEEERLGIPAVAPSAP